MDPATHFAGAEQTIHDVETYLGILIGAVTFSGSVIAFGKLNGRIGGKPLLLPARHWLNLGLLVAAIWFAVLFVDRSAAGGGMGALMLMTIVALVFGVHMVMAIGGADMPVVVSMLNSYSGWAASATGFMLSNDLLIVTGALVGSSGAILCYIMCRAMNRRFLSVIAGGFGTGGGTSAAAGDEEQGEVVPIDAHEAASLLVNAREVMIIPGYGMAVAQAQHVVNEITKTLREKGINVRFAHPPGRRPHARAHECAARRGKSSLRHRLRDGRNQRRVPGRRRVGRHRRKRHRQSLSTGRAGQSDRRHAGAGSAGKAGRPSS